MDNREFLEELARRVNAFVVQFPQDATGFMGTEIEMKGRFGNMLKRGLVRPGLEPAPDLVPKVRVAQVISMMMLNQDDPSVSIGPKQDANGQFCGVQVVDARQRPGGGPH